MPVATFSGSLNYCSVDQMVAVQPSLGSSFTDITSSQLAYAAWRGEADIHSRLAKTFTLPFSYTVPTITAINIDLGIYYALRTGYTGETQEVQLWVDRWENANKRLDAIAEGTEKLVANDGTLIPDRSGYSDAWSNTMGYVQTATELPVGEDRVDPDKITDLRADRDIVDG